MSREHQFPLLTAARSAQPIRSIHLTLLRCLAGQFRRLMGATMRVRMLVVAIAATVGLFTAAIAAQMQVTRHVRPVTVATLHHS